MTKWILYHNTSGTPRLRLFCLPYAGAGASVYRNWQQRFQLPIEICAFQLPGRESRFAEIPERSLDPLVSELADELRLFNDLPFAIFGHSMGGLVGFELARRCACASLSPVHLFVSATPAPDWSDFAPLWHQLPDDLLVQALKDIVCDSSGVLEHAEFRSLILPIVRADMEVCESYKYAVGTRLTCPITAFAGRWDRKVVPAAVAGWKRQTTCRFDLKYIDGAHLYLEDQWRAVIGTIEEHLRPVSAQIRR